MIGINLMSLSLTGDITILALVIFIAAMYAQLHYMCLIIHNFGRVRLVMSDCKMGR